MAALKVVLLEISPERTRETVALLAAAGCEVTAILPLDPASASLLPAQPADLALASVGMPDDTLFDELAALQSAHTLPTVLLAADDAAGTVRRAVSAGICAYVVDGVQPDRLQPILVAAMARFQRLQSLHEELDRTRAQLSERKLIERAKGLLMAQRQISENAAYSLMRRTAMDRNKRVADIAENIVAASELLDAGLQAAPGVGMGASGQ